MTIYSLAAVAAFVAAVMVFLDPWLHDRYVDAVDRFGEWVTR